VCVVIHNVIQRLLLINADSSSFSVVKLICTARQFNVVRLSYRNFLDRGKSEMLRLLNHNAIRTDLFFLKAHMAPPEFTDTLYINVTRIFNVPYFL